MTGVASESRHSSPFPALTARAPGTTTAPSGTTSGRSAVGLMMSPRTRSYTGVDPVRTVPAAMTARALTIAPSYTPVLPPISASSSMMTGSAPTGSMTPPICAPALTCTPAPTCAPDPTTAPRAAARRWLARRRDRPTRRRRRERQSDRRERSHERRLYQIEFFQGLQNLLARFGLRRTHREAIGLLEQPHCGHRGFHRDGIGLDEIDLHQRDDPVVDGSRRGEIVSLRGLHHLRHLRRNLVRGDRDDAATADRHQRQRQRIEIGRASCRERV